MTLRSTSDVLAQYRDGDGQGWDVEMAECRERVHYPALLADIREHGIQTPIVLGNDRRVWDGHHRLTAAVDLGLAAVPVTHA